MHPARLAPFLVAVTLACAATPALARPGIDARINQLLARMTLREKVGQMTQISEGGNLTGPGGTVGLEASIRAGDVGSVLNALGVDRTRALQRLAVEKTRLHIPLIFGLDVIHGYHTTFPIPLAEACSWDLAAIERSAHVAAAEAASDGIHWTFAPMVDIARDPRWGRISEGAGEDVYLGSQIAKARVRGFQGKDLTAPDSVVACVKHFAAYGAAMAGRDYNTVDISRRTLLETYLPTYKAAIDAGARTVMSSFNEVDGVPASGNAMLLHDVLVDHWKFPGFVVSDWGAVEEMIAHGTAKDLSDAARQSAIAGLQMDMQSQAYARYLPVLVRQGKVPMATIDDAVRRILRVKFEKGLFDDPYRACNAARRDRTEWAPANLQASLDMARESIVLLKNEDHLLPLAPGKKVALIGPLAADREDMVGSWPGQPDPKRAKSVLDGLKAHGVYVTYVPGCEIQDHGHPDFDQALNAAKRADVVVAVVGEAALMSGEAASRADIDLPGFQPDLLAALRTTGKPIVMVVMSGRPLTLSDVEPDAGAILQAWHLGTQAGLAVADVLMGTTNPSGHLVTTFPRAVGQIPLFYDHMNTGRPYNPKDHYTSQYMDVPNSPLYPFGYGLSYTRFTFGPLKLANGKLVPGGKLHVETTLTNAGDCDGTEVAQLYIRQRVGSVNRPVRQLKGFRRVFLKRGASTTLAFDLTPRDLAFWRRDWTYGTEAGTFDVWVGADSASGSHATFQLTKPTTFSTLAQGVRP